MSDIHERLQQARIRAGYDSALAASKRLGVSYNLYAQHENGTRGYPVAKAQLYARAFGVQLNWLLTGKGDIAAKQAPEIPIVGKAGASTTDGYFLNAYADGAHPTLDPIPEGAISVDVVGDSMKPRFKDGERLIFGPENPDADPFIGQEVLVYLGDEDGRTLIKTLDRNKTTGNYNLKSYNSDHPIIEDVKVAWVRPLLGMRK
ncbi:MAG: LexA family transcriptional regulator [Asticcacaulis sp.]